jgi:hypothetical protein
MPESDIPSATVSICPASASLVRRQIPKFNSIDNNRFWHRAETLSWADGRIGEARWGSRHGCFKQPRQCSGVLFMQPRWRAAGSRLPDVVAPTCGTRGMGRPGPFNLLRSFDVRFTPKADIAERDWELRFVP